ncbi:phasin family protein [Allofustis seminis]|uniref:phasin family protein n=1 Tax=Allofustis seminis TaxID=166939 RepID=UPI00036E2B2D|nr:hypothetical protein [Allofustis seminis]
MLEDLKQLGLIGLGGTFLIADKLTEKIEELVNQGKLTVQEGKELTEELIRESKADAEKEGSEKVKKLIENLGLARAEDLKQLVSRVEALEAHLNMNVENTEKQTEE